MRPGFGGRRVVGWLACDGVTKYGVTKYGVTKC
jgi:hypothetical protein